MCNPSGELAADSLETLGSLVDKSLLRRTESAAGSRFEMLETIRDYAREQLKAVDPDGLTASRHARHMLSLAEAAASELTKADGQWRTRLGAEIDNLRSALAWTIDSGDADTGMRMCAALWRFWQMRAVLSEGREWCDRVLAIPQPSNPSSVHARALLAAGNLAYWQRDPAAANRHYRQGLAEAEAMGGDRLQADALVDLLYLTRLYPEVADGDESEGLARRIKGLGKRLGDPVLGAQADFARAGPLVGQGRVAQAHPLVESARQVFEASGDLFLAASANSIAGGLALTEGDLNEARKRTQRAAEFLHALGDEITLQMVLRTLALIAGRTGEPERAAQIHGFAARLVADTGGVRFDAPFESEDALELASRTIGRERADEEWRKGQQMTRDEAMAVARALGNSDAQP